MTDADQVPESRQPAPLAVPQAPIGLPDLSVPTGDLAEHYQGLDDIARQAREAITPSVLVLPGLVTSDSEGALDLGDDGEDLLEDARANIANGAYALALEQLEEFLEFSPGHPEARYLQAYCHYRLGGPGQTEALRILRPLRDEPLDGELRVSVQQLRVELRRVLTPDELLAFLETVPRDPHVASHRLQGFIELVPEEPLPPYLLAVTQAQRGEDELALRTAQAGADTAEGDTRLLRALVDQLREVRARTMAAGAVGALRDGKYQRARNKLRKLDAEWRQTELLRDLDAFLDDLCERGHPPGTPLPVPRGIAGRVGKLYWLITGEDVQEAVPLLAAGRFAEAERLLTRALRIAPGFSWLNFLYAYSLHTQGKEPKRAVAAAEIAARDPSIPQADRLLQAVREMREVLTINAAVEEHNAAMKSVSGNLSRQQLVALQRTMERVRARLPELRSVATTRHSAQRVRDLAKVVDQRLAEIEQALGASEVSELVGRFNRLVEQVSMRGLTSADRTKLRAIIEEAVRLQRTVTDRRAQKLLQELLDAARRIGD